MKLRLIFILLLLLSGSATAEDNKFEDNFPYALRSVFASAGEIKYAVRKTDELPLGYYYETGELDQVNFHHCPEGTPLVRVSRAELEDAGDVNCKSLPGVPRDPFSNAIVAKWTFDASKEGYIVEEEQNEISSFVPCQNAPASMIEAAKQARANTWSIVGNDKETLDAVVKALNVMNPHYISENGATTNDCLDEPYFWTVPIGSIGSKNLFAVTTNIPFNDTDNK